jgi:hypothetical protein
LHSCDKRRKSAGLMPRLHANTNELPVGELDVPVP